MVTINAWVLAWGIAGLFSLGYLIGSLVALSGYKNIDN
jgi:hypothetical protein